MILLNQVLHLIVIGRQLSSLLFHQRLCRQFAFRLLHQRVDNLISQLFTDITLLHELQDALLMIFERLKVLVFLHQNDMVAIG